MYEGGMLKLKFNRLLTGEALVWMTQSHPYYSTELNGAFSTIVMVHNGHC